jgi:hypothetical protein
MKAPWRGKGEELAGEELIILLATASCGKFT